jgi:hypothetical protein
MKRPTQRVRPPLFLPRPEYRRRRLVDAARLLPLFGGFLMLVPILWAPAGVQGRDTARDGIYLFAIWAVLVALAAWLAPRLADAADDAEGLGNEALSDDQKDDA